MRVVLSSVARRAFLESAFVEGLIVDSEVKRLDRESVMRALLPSLPPLDETLHRKPEEQADGESEAKAEAAA